MRLLWHSNAPWAGTGYGQQTGLFVPLLRDQGHQIAISAFWGLYGQPMNWEGFQVYPAGVDQFGNDVLTSHALHFFEGNAAAGAIITLMDMWVMKSPSLHLFTVGAWTPVDHAPCPPEVAASLRRHQATPIAMSLFGQRQLQQAGLDAQYVPHGIDTRVFNPQACSRERARELLALPKDAWVCGMVAANKGDSPPRKAFPQAFQAFKQLAAKHSDAILYCHSESQGHHAGINLELMAEAFGISKQIRFTDQYALQLGIPQSAMPAVYRAFDVLLNPSYGEGFGVPIIEAQACGTPVIVSDCTSMPELVGAGWTVEVDQWWDSRQAAFYGYPKPESILSALKAAYKTPRNERKAVDFARQYDARQVAETFWPPVLRALEQRLPTSAKPINLAALEVPA